MFTLELRIGYSVPSYWNYLGRIRRRGLVGESVSLGWALKIQKPSPAQPLYAAGGSDISL